MKPMLLCILDGVGLKNNDKGNALGVAKMPNFDYLLKNYPNSILKASGEAVGLPSGQMGNSEVGHINIGTGRAIKQSIDIINDSFNSGGVRDNKQFLDLIYHVKTNNSSLHLFGLLSDGGIHSHISHLFNLIDILKEFDLDVCYHVFTDGRDTQPHESLKFIHMLQKKINDTGVGKIVTISGRYYSMDRDNRWDRIKKSYDIMTHEGNIDDIDSKIVGSYDNNITDEFIEPFRCNEGVIKDGDGLLVFNFRPDRLRELFSAFTNPNFDGFKRDFIGNLKLVTMMPVDKSVICSSMFSHPRVDNYLGKVFEKNGLSQLRIAETEKYAHVTYFFDGENKVKLNNCDQILIPSKKISTYDLAPEMSAYEITNILLNKMENYDIIILNFANGDMVGHTGNFKATVKGLEVVDECIGKIYKKIQDLNGVMIITADHGNCDSMVDEKGNVLTAHSLSDVPLIITLKDIKLMDGRLCDVAPTMLYLLGLDVPSDMTGKILVK